MLLSRAVAEAVDDADLRLVDLSATENVPEDDHVFTLEIHP